MGRQDPLIRVRVETQEARRNFNGFAQDASKGMDRMGRSAQQAGNVITGQGGLLAGLALMGNQRSPILRLVAGLAGPVGLVFAVGAVAAVMGKAAKDAASLEAELVKLNTQLGISEDVIVRTTDQVAVLSRRYGRSQVEIAKAGFAINSAGLRGADAVLALDEATKAAILGLGRVKDVGIVASASIAAYGRSAYDASRTTEILRATVEAGKLVAEELTTSIGRALPIAAALGVSFEELGASVAFYSRRGLSAAESTTGVRAALFALAKPTQGAIEEFQKMGETVESVQARVRTDGFLRTLQFLRDAVGDNEQAFARIFGRIRAFNFALAATEDEGGREALMHLHNIENSVGDVDRAFQRVTETTQYRFDVAMAKLQGTLIDLGNATKRPLTGLLSTLADISSNLLVPADVRAERTLAAEVQDLADEAERLARVDLSRAEAQLLALFVTLQDQETATDISFTLDQILQLRDLDLDPGQTAIFISRTGDALRELYDQLGRDIDVPDNFFFNHPLLRGTEEFARAVNEHLDVSVDVKEFRSRLLELVPAMNEAFRELDLPKIRTPLDILDPDTGGGVHSFTLQYSLQLKALGLEAGLATRLAEQLHGALLDAALAEHQARLDAEALRRELGLASTEFEKFQRTVSDAERELVRMSFGTDEAKVGITGYELALREANKQAGMSALKTGEFATELELQTRVVNVSNEGTRTLNDLIAAGVPLVDAMRTAYAAALPQIEAAKDATAGLAEAQEELNRAYTATHNLIGLAALRERVNRLRELRDETYALFVTGELPKTAFDSVNAELREAEQRLANLERQLAFAVPGAEDMEKLGGRNDALLDQIRAQIDAYKELGRRGKQTYDTIADAIEDEREVARRGFEDRRFELEQSFDLELAALRADLTQSRRELEFAETVLRGQQRIQLRALDRQGTLADRIFADRLEEESDEQRILSQFVSDNVARLDAERDALDRTNETLDDIDEKLGQIVINTGADGWNYATAQQRADFGRQHGITPPQGVTSEQVALMSLIREATALGVNVPPVNALSPDQYGSAILVLQEQVRRARDQSGGTNRSLPASGAVTIDAIIAERTR